MKRYESQLKGLLRVIGLGYGIGFAISLLLVFIVAGGASLSDVGAIVGLGIIVGSVITIILSGSSNTQNMIVNLAFNASRSLFGGLLSAGFGWGMGIFLFIIKFMFYGVIVVALFLFAGISLPLSLVYTVIMFFIEKQKGGVDDDLADTLDKVVPVVAAIVTAVCLYFMM